MCSALLVVLLGGVSAAGQPPTRITDLQPTVLLISIDGFRADYLDRGVTPNLIRIAKSGVRAEWMQPAFPTKTFPNHYTIVTGLYPEHHGIVGNEFWDPENGKQFKYNQPVALETQWWGGEPIWITAEKQGVKAGTLFWPGAEVQHNGQRASHWMRYQHEMPNRERVRRILAWLDKPANERPQLLTMYFHMVDTAGHDHGPDSPQLMAALKAVDASLGALLDGLRQRGIERQVNLVIVSDHGMAYSRPEQKIFLEDYMDLAGVQVAVWGQVLSIASADGNHEALIASLQKLPHAKVFKKCDLPERLHYCRNPRISPVIVMADEGWEVTTREHTAKNSHDYGMHGYDNALPSMRALFIARGPGLKSNKRIPGFANIHVYALMCQLLGIQPAPNDGSLDPFRTVLRKQEDRPPKRTALSTTVRLGRAGDSHSVERAVYEEDGNGEERRRKDMRQRGIALLGSEHDREFHGQQTEQRSELDHRVHRY
jgi:predicted AlkP superfamily pyrophosphatase or phosphodiesterase